MRCLHSIRWLFLAAIIFLGPTQVNAQAPLPDDLSRVPSDAIFFAHIRLADLWKSEAMKDFREIVMKAGIKTIDAFDKRFVPNPSTIDRLTVFLLAPKGMQPEPPVVFLLRTTKDIDENAFLQSAMPDAKKQAVGQVTIYVANNDDVAVRFASKNLLAFGPKAGMLAWAEHTSKSEPIKDALTLGADGPMIVMGLNAGGIAAKLLAEFQEQIPPPLRPLLQMKLVTMAMDFKTETTISVGATYADGRSAELAHDTIKQVAGMAKQELAKVRKELMPKIMGDGKITPLSDLPEAAGSLFVLGLSNYAEEILDNPPIVRKENTLQMQMKLPGWMSGYFGMVGMSVGLLMPAVQKVREAAARATNMNNLKQIGLAMHFYASKYDVFPSAAICDKNGKPLLSWRVAILPYIEQENLYRRFKLDEPWDSENNKKLIPLMPKIYAHPSDTTPQPGYTNYRVFVGNGAAFEWKQGMKFTAFTDGPSNTLLAAESADKVIWTKPEEFEFDPKKPLPKLGGLATGGFMAAFADGSVRFISNTTKDDILKALITRAGGEVIPILP